MWKAPQTLCMSLLLAILGEPLLGQPITALSNPVYINFNMPELVLDSDIYINDPNNNNTLDANEKMQVSFFIANRGEYVANSVKVRTHVIDPKSGVQGTEDESLGNLAKGERRLIKRLILGGADLKSGETEVEFQILESDSIAEVITHKINTFSEARTPRLEIIAYEFFSLDKGGSIRPNTEFELRIRLKNSGGAPAKEVEFDINHQKHIVVLSDLESTMVPELEPNAVVERSFRFFMGPNYTESKIPIRIRVFDVNTGSGETHKLTDAIVNE